jgi:hypothetical protein
MLECYKLKASHGHNTIELVTHSISRRKIGTKNQTSNPKGKELTINFHLMDEDKTSSRQSRHSSLLFTEKESTPWTSLESVECVS